jgi:hypothetical protein
MLWSINLDRGEERKINHYQTASGAILRRSCQLSMDPCEGPSYIHKTDLSGLGSEDIGPKKLREKTHYGSKGKPSQCSLKTTSLPPKPLLLPWIRMCMILSMGGKAD